MVAERARALKLGNNVTVQGDVPVLLLGSNRSRQRHGLLLVSDNGSDYYDQVGGPNSDFYDGGPSDENLSGFAPGGPYAPSDKGSSNNHGSKGSDDNHYDGS